MQIIDRRTKLKARRVLRKQKRQVEDVAAQADNEINRLVIKRFGRLFVVKRFMAVWLVLIVGLGIGTLWQVNQLDSYYLKNAPISGGIYREGIIGIFTNANPMFGTSSVDASVSRLLFSGLFTIDKNGELVGDLADDITIDEDGRIYTVTLKKDVEWHDGEKFDASDVVFTYSTIQKVEARSPLRSNWSGVKVESTDPYTVVFTLPNSFSSFQYSLTNGIVPEHILSRTDPVDLRSSKFNTVEAVGTGPFKLRTIEVVGNDIETRRERIAMTTNENYHGKKVGLDGVIIRSYRTEDAMLEDFNDQVIQSMVGATSSIDDQLQDDTVKRISAPLTSSVMVFFNNAREGLNDRNVRQALVQAVDVATIRNALTFQPIASDSPFLRNQFPYNPEIVQLPYDKEQAIKLLDASGWLLNSENKREKDGKILKFRLVSQSLSDYALITQKLQQNWNDLGVSVEVVLQPEEDIQSGAIAQHDYDILLYGISIGHDPDVFAYWHSSRTDPNAPSQLNLSEYKNDIADEALEAGRTRQDKELRKIKYEPFLKQWREDAPAIALYQPQFSMIVQGTFEGFDSRQLLNAADRYSSIADWKIRNDKVIK